MCQKIRKERITKREWYGRGGAWRYYVDIERDAQQRAS